MPHQHWRGAAPIECKKKVRMLNRVYPRCVPMSRTLGMNLTGHVHAQQNTTTVQCTTNLIGAYGPRLGVVSSCKVSPNITMMCLGRGARNKPAATLHYNSCPQHLEFVSARLPSSGPGHHPGTTNFNPSSATLDTVETRSASHQNV